MSIKVKLNKRMRKKRRRRRKRTKGEDVGGETKFIKIVDNN